MLKTPTLKKLIIKANSHLSSNRYNCLQGIQHTSTLLWSVGSAPMDDNQSNLREKNLICKL